MQLTAEQQKIIESTGDIRINAVAGSGKTTTLVAYAKSRPPQSRILYLAFNRSVKDEAIRKFTEAGVTNVNVETAHSMAFRGIVRRHGYEVGFHSPVQIASRLFETGHPSTDQVVAATHIERFAALFCNSPVKKVEELDYAPFVKDEVERKKVVAQYDSLLLLTRKYLAAMHRREIPMSHDLYLKMFQLENPQLPFDYILFDEAQDASPVMVEIVKNQTHTTRVIVGDSHQQIYRWRHAVNSMELFDFNQFTLTKSFRFPQSIADLAVAIVDTKRHFMEHPVIKIEGHPRDSNEKVVSRAVIGRTNISLLAEAIALVKSNGKNFKIYFEGHIRSYLFGDEEGSLSDVLNLYSNKREYIKNEIVQRCSDIDELKEYAKRMADSQLTQVIELVNKHGKDLPMLLGMLHNRHLTLEERHNADYYFSTVHRCKGLEYDEVFLSSDFTFEKMIFAIRDDPERLPDEIAEEINLLYVAITRAKIRLNLPKDFVPQAFTGATRPHIRITSDTDSMEKLDSAISKKQWSPRRGKVISKRSVGKFWTDNEETILVQQYRRGKPLREIALELGRSREAIRKRLQQLNVLNG